MDEKIIAALLGASLGAFLASLFGIFTALFLEKRKNKNQVKSIVSAFYGELSVIAELLGTDMKIQDEASFFQEKDRVKLVVERIYNTRTVFASMSGQLGLLPGSLPEALVRFYGRINPKLSKAVTIFTGLETKNLRDDLKNYKKIIEELSVECESLIHDLKKIINSNSTNLISRFKQIVYKNRIDNSMYKKN